MWRHGNIPRSRLSGLIALLLGLTLAATYAQPAGVLSSKSLSGQFVLVTPPNSAALSWVDRRLVGAAGMVELDPTFLPISCERIKLHIARELGTGPAWKSKIFLTLHRAVPGEPGVLVTSDRYYDAWQYTVNLPTPVDRVVFIRSIVQVILTEMANRNSFGPTATTAEVPTWLIEGLSRQILASHQAEVILPPTKVGQNGIGFTPTLMALKEKPLKPAHQILRDVDPLSFEGLSWPRLETDGSASEVYGASAHLFVSRLLQLPNGRPCLKVMIESLPARQNWQFAFFHAFSPYFQTPLDVEKWWALQALHFTGREIGQSWSLPESCQKVRETLHVTVQVFRTSKDLPSENRLPLQAAVRQWKPQDQEKVLEQKARELEMLRLRVAPELAPLVEDYRLALTDWLEGLNRRGVLFGLGRRAAQARVGTRAAHQLDALDLQLLSFQDSK